MMLLDMLGCEVIDVVDDSEGLDEVEVAAMVEEELDSGTVEVSWAMED